MNWENVTIEKFQKLKDYLESNTEATDDIDRIANIISIVKDVSLDEVFEMPLDDFLKESRDVMFTAREPVPDLRDKFKIDEVTYDFCPSVEKMITGQYIDLNSALSKHPVDLAFLMSCVYIPRDDKGKKRKYCEGYDSLAVRDIFHNKLPITYAVGAAVFFKESFRSLSNSILRFLNWKLRKALKTEKNLKKKVQIRKSIDAIKDSLSAMDGLS